MSTATKDRPILFSGPMVRAILADAKTQTRRVVKPQPEWLPEVTQARTTGPLVWPIGAGGQQCGHPIKCPYGVPGDRLWVREEHYRFGHWEKVPGVKTATGRVKWQFVGDSDEVLFEQPRELSRAMNAPYFDRPGWYKRVARHMPRWASRIDLEVTGVRVERLQDISESDAIAEGLTEYVWPEHTRSYPNVATQLACGTRFWNHVIQKRGRRGCVWDSAKKAFREFWQDINGPQSWNANPWVWVVEFKRIGGAS